MLIARRTDDSHFTDWYYGVDRALLFCVLGLILIGMIAAISTGSAMTVRKGWHWYHFFVSMLPFYIGGFATMFVVSLLNKRNVMIVAWINVIVCLLLLFVTLVHPVTINGSSRWVGLSGINIMPSDILKPGFVMVTAWFISKMKERFGENIFTRDTLKFGAFSWWTYIALFGFIALVLFKQPDIGTLLLYGAVAGGMLFVAGLPLKICGILGLVVLCGGVGAFFLKHHVHERVIDFFKPLDPNTQVGYSINSIRQGGLFGMGDEAFATEKLPMAESDFVYAALVEDFGAILACIMLCVMLYMINRLIRDARGARDPFVFYATSGAALLFAFQISINLATTLNLMPPTGITLPFISFGGSSFLSFCLLFGMLFAIIREDKWK
ncbi:MAG: FtsW/RodA/SpoVE family cell cycle protein [Proteobacteria bacterium]|nr:FtsW/RodA/SpoVE family cell cycle protein [Candidatus Enterousia scatequi]